VVGRFATTKLGFSTSNRRFDVPDYGIDGLQERFKHGKCCFDVDKTSRMARPAKKIPADLTFTKNVTYLTVESGVCPPATQSRVRRLARWWSVSLILLAIRISRLRTLYIRVQTGKTELRAISYAGLFSGSLRKKPFPAEVAR